MSEVALAVCVLLCATCAVVCAALARRSLPSEMQRALSSAARRMDQYDRDQLEAQADRTAWSKHLQGVLEEIEGESQRIERKRRSAAGYAARAERAAPDASTDPRAQALQAEIAAFQSIGRR